MTGLTVTSDAVGHLADEVARHGDRPAETGGFLLSRHATRRAVWCWSLVWLWEWGRLPGADRQAQAARTATDEAGPQTTGPLTAILPRQPGSREARYAHLLGAPPDLSLPQHDSSEASPSNSSTTQRIVQLEAEVATLIASLQTLKDRVDRLESGA